MSGTGERDARHIGLVWLTAAGAYCLIAYGTMQLATFGNAREIATLWPANAALAALLLCQARPMWRTVLSGGFVGSILAGIMVHGQPALVLAHGVSQLIEVSVVVLILRGRFSESDILTSPSTLAWFVGAAGIAAPLVKGISCVAMAITGFSDEAGRLLLTWMMADSLGLLIFTPLFIALLDGDFVRGFRERDWLQNLEAVAWLAVTAAVAWLAFFEARRPLLFAIFAPAMLVTFRVGPLGTKIALAIVTVMGALATMHEIGPLPWLTPDRVNQALFFQGFSTILLLTCLPVAAELNARRSLSLKLAEREHEMSLRAMTDGLTGLLNRAAFQERAAELLAEAGRAPVCLLALDLDHFKRVNDQWGHHAGDRALLHLAAILRASLRGIDLVARIGGDEFMILLPRTETQEAERIGQRIRHGMRRAPLCIDESTEALLTISCGIARAEPGQGYEALARQADRALYLAKEAGRNTIRHAA